MSTQTYDNYYREYYQKNKERIQFLRKTKYKFKGYNKSKTYTQEFRMWNQAKQTSKRNSLPFEISVEDIHIPQICPILGIPLDAHDRNHTPSLDKTIPAKGYIKGNIAIISMKANRMKQDITPDILKLFIQYYKNIKLLRK